jgi:hypothetical protein
VILALFVALLGFSSEAFIVDATAEHEVSIAAPVEHVVRCVNDVGLLRRHMPGVVDIREIGVHQFAYRTEREMPFSGTVSTDFVIDRHQFNDSTVVYRTPDIAAVNYMSFTFAVRRDGVHAVAKIRLRVRLSREDARDIHVLAPLLGADFISDRMEEDLLRMLREFAQKGKAECENGAILAGQEAK